MDLIVGFPWTRRQIDSIWFVDDRMNKFAYFIPFKSTYLMEDYERSMYIYIYKILTLHCILLSFISDRSQLHLVFEIV